MGRGVVLVVVVVLFCFFILVYVKDIVYHIEYSIQSFANS